MDLIIDFIRDHKKDIITYIVAVVILIVGLFVDKTFINNYKTVQGEVLEAKGMTMSLTTQMEEAKQALTEQQSKGRDDAYIQKDIEFLTPIVKDLFTFDDYENMHASFVMEYDANDDFSIWKDLFDGGVLSPDFDMNSLDDMKCVYKDMTYTVFGIDSASGTYSYLFNVAFDCNGDARRAMVTVSVHNHTEIISLDGSMMAE